MARWSDLAGMGNDWGGVVLEFGVTNFGWMKGRKYVMLCESSWGKLGLKE